MYIHILPEYIKKTTLNLITTKKIKILKLKMKSKYIQKYKQITGREKISVKTNETCYFSYRITYIISELKALLKLESNAQVILKIIY